MTCGILISILNPPYIIVCFFLYLNYTIVFLTCQSFFLFVEYSDNGSANILKIHPAKIFEKRLKKSLTVNLYYDSIEV